MKIHVESDAYRAANACAAWIGEQARRALADRERFSLALSGGSGPRPLFEALAREPVDWQRIELFQVDERAAPPGSPDRNFHAIRTLLVERARIPAAQVHPMPVGQENLEAAAADYAATLERVLGPARVLDLVHLGLGEDGHTASLLPGDPAADSGVPVIVSMAYRGFRRLSFNYSVLSGARQRCWFVTGMAKSGAVARVVEGDRAVPAGRIERRDSHLFVDRAAAAELEDSVGFGASPGS
jgi:6-phosphogluconolactonase